MREDGQRTCFTLGKLKTKGGILLYDDMEGILKWGTPIGWALAGLFHSGAHAYQGNYGIGLWKRIRFPNGVWFHTARIFCRRPETWAFEASCLFRLPAIAPAYGYRLVLDVRQAGYRRLCGIHWDNVAGEYRYIDSNGTWVVVPGSPPGLSDEGWHRLWIRVEFERGVYLSVGADSISFEIGGESLYVRSWVHPESAQVVLGMHFPYVGLAGVSADEVLVREV